jgi:hypothetical protein
MSKTTKLLDRRGNIPAIDLKYTGEEPTWEDVDNLSVDDYYRRRSRALSFYAYYCDSTTLRPFLTKWMGTNGYTKTQVKMIESAPAWSVSSTVGKLVRMLQRGMPDIHPDSSNYFLRYKSDENPNPKPEKASTFIHKELTKNILPAHKQGKYRTGNMFVVTSEGKIDYVAPIASKIEFELEKFYTDLELLLTADLSFEEIFYFASFLHLIFVKIHPFEDGNGRTARLIEKWFLSEKLGEKAWFISSEKNYYENHNNYYSAIRKIYSKR